LRRPIYKRPDHHIELAPCWTRCYDKQQTGTYIAQILRLARLVICLVKHCACLTNLTVFILARFPLTACFKTTKGM
jgi:hypothetical protein